MLKEEVQAEETFVAEKEVWDEWENRLVTWSLTAAISALVLASLFINFFLV